MENMIAIMFTLRVEKEPLTLVRWDISRMYDEDIWKGEKNEKCHNENHLPDSGAAFSVCGMQR